VAAAGSLAALPDVAAEPVVVSANAGATRAAAMRLRTIFFIMLSFDVLFATATWGMIYASMLTVC